MTRRRISNRTPRELTAKERSALSDVVLELDSDFRVKTGSVEFVGDYTPVSGVHVISEHDGRMYYADDYGWHLQGADTPVLLFVDYTDTQFDFKFKAPSTSTLKIYDGDGTVTSVAGQDDTVVTHTTNYAAAGKYAFHVEGDVLDLTSVNIQNQSFVSGDVSGWGKLVNLTYITCRTTGVYGDISGWSALVNLTDLFCWSTNVSGDVSSWSALTSLTILSCFDSDVSGDVSGWSALTLVETLYCHQTKVTGDISGWAALTADGNIFSGENFVKFNAVNLWARTGIINISSVKNFTSAMVDNALQSFVNLIGCTIDLGGTNPPRTSASDAAYATVNAANTLTVNE